MPTPYIDNIQRWIVEAEVDFFSYFIKAWIPFNAWFRNHYDQEKQERAIIDLIKNDGNVVRSRIVRLISETDSEAEEFREYIAQLHRRLEQHTITNRSQRVTFTHCYVGPNTQAMVSGQHQGTNYVVERGTPGNATLSNNHVQCTLTRTTGEILFQKRQSLYNLDELRADNTFVALSPTRQAKIISLYTSINPRLEVNLLDVSGRVIEVGRYQFCDNPEHIFAGLVETIYALRNLLFHGEIVPTSEINGIYQSGYYILRRFLQSIV